MFMVDLTGESNYAVLGVDPNAGAAEIREARDRLVRRLRDRERREPGRRQELVDQQKRVNAAADRLVRPAQREAYDRDNPHLRFLTPRRAAAPVFLDRQARLDVLQRAVAAHLAAAGAPLRHTPDLDQPDATADWTPNPLLDGAE